LTRDAERTNSGVRRFHALLQAFLHYSADDLRLSFCPTRATPTRVPPATIPNSFYPWGRKLSDSLPRYREPELTRRSLQQDLDETHRGRRWHQNRCLPRSAGPGGSREKTVAEKPGEDRLRRGQQMVAEGRKKAAVS
jgi:hypothetical protein